MSKKWYLYLVIILMVIILVVAGIFKYTEYRQNQNLFEIVRSIDYSGVELQVVEKINDVMDQTVKEPDNSLYCGRLGMNLYIHGYKKEAIPLFKRAAELDDQDFRWPYLCAIALSEMANEDPVPYFEQGIKLKPEYPPLIIKLANLYLIKGEMEKAEQLFSKIIESGVKIPHAHLGLAKIAIQNNQLSEAEKQLQSVIDLVPNYREARALLADVYRRQGNSERAEQEFQTMQILPPRLDLSDPVYQEMEQEGVSSFWYQVRANNYLEQGKLSEAETELKKAVVARPNAVSYTSLGYVYQIQKQYDRAVAQYRQALQLDSNYINALNNLSVIYYETGKVQDAFTLLSHSLALNPESIDGYLNLGTFMKGEGRWQEAIDCFNRGRELAPQDMRFVYQLAWLKATAPVRKVRNGAEAVQLAEMLCKTSNYQNPAALDVLAAALAEKTDFSTAQKTASRAYVLARLQKKHELARDIEVRQKLYEKNQPYRQQK